MRIKVFLFVICICLCSVAQTQQGLVKTKGRLAANGSVISGTRLSGVMVTVRGRNAVLSGSNGVFSLAIPGNSYYLQNVQKQGYVITDPDILSRQYAYSKNPLILVLETQEQQTDDKLLVERKIRRNLQRQLRQREEEIETLKEENKITKQEYQEQLKKLYEEQKINEMLISDMSEHYAKIDYDQMDEFNTLITKYILDGELTKADSLLRTKGDISVRAAELQQLQEQNAKEEAELSKRKKKLEKNKEMAQKELEDIAQDCLSKFEIFKMQHLNDSAAYYIELRARLDTLNLYWLNDAAEFLTDYLARHEDALCLYKKMVEVAETQYGPESDKTAFCYNNLATFFLNLNIFKYASEYFSKANAIYKGLGDDYSKLVAFTENNIGALYSDQQDYEEALHHHDIALSIFEKLDDVKEDDFANVYNSMGYSYYKMRDFQKAESYYNKAKDIWKRIYGENSEQVNIVNNNIAAIMHQAGRYGDAYKMYQDVLSYRLKVYGDAHPKTATIYTNMSSLYLAQNELDSADLYLNRSIEIYKQVYGNMDPRVADCYGDLAEILLQKNDKEGSLALFKKAYDIALTTRGPDKSSTRDLLTNIDYLLAKMAIEKDDDAIRAKREELMYDKIYTAYVPKTEASPAYQLGMSGEYYILEYEDWNVESPSSMLIVNENYKGKSKTITFYQSGQIVKQHFENVIGINIYLKEIGQEEKQNIIVKYQEWKNQK